MKKNVRLNFADLCITVPEPGGWILSVMVCQCTEFVEELTVELTAQIPERPPEFAVQFAISQHDIVCRWHANACFDKNVIPEWGPGFSGELASGAPVIGFSGQNGVNRMVCASSDALRKTLFSSGICEYTFEVSTVIRFFTLPEPPTDSCRIILRFDRRAVPFAQALRDAFRWYEQREEYRPAPTPADGFGAWYSTWYSYHKDLHDYEIEAECRLAKSLGMSGVIVDDGWQTETSEGIYDYCGDWQVAAGRIADMAAHVRRVHEMGLKYLLWYSVPFIGDKSRNFTRFAGKYLYRSDRLHASVLDPRFPEVREFLISLYTNALRDWDLDGFKLDFIDRFVIPEGESDPASDDNYAGRDFKSIPEATDALLTGVMTALRAVKPDILIEFRQKYMGPAIRKYGNLIRAADCPGDLVANRCRTIDLRLSSGGTAVHGDMLCWHKKENVEAAARQLLAILFAVPQISVRLTELSADHLAMLRHRLEFYTAYRETLTRGRLYPVHPELNYPVVRAEGDGEAITAIYLENSTVECPGLAVGLTEIIVNATAVPEIVLKISQPCRFRTFDALGRTSVAVELASGLNEVIIPPSGECILECLPPVDQK